MRLWLQLGEGNSWEGGGVGDAVVGYVDSPRSQVVALLLAHSSPPLLLFLLASPCSLLPYSNPFPCGNVPMSWPHSTPAGKGRSPALGPTSQPLPTPPRRAGHPPTQLMPPSTSPPGPSPGQSLRSGPRHLELPPALVLAQRALPWPAPAPLHSYPALPYLARQTHPCHRHLLKAELRSQHWRKE